MMDVRQTFLEFFAQRGHRIVPSAPVVPRDDPTLLFTNAGMNPFKPYFLGQATPENRRVADTQKCIRVSGKHNDLEEVGQDTYHHTFFEMLGNWSFGDYYKAEAIEWAWELLTRVWGLPRERLYATVFAGDDEVPADEETARLWTRVTDIDPRHVLRFGRRDNFWMMGEVGPCGPCSEIHIDLTPGGTGGERINAGSPLTMELWNLVFIEFNAEEGGRLRRLPARHVDTGMGLERIAAVLECTDSGRRFDRPISNYDTALFRPLLAALEELSGRRYTPGLSRDETSIAMRVCADHARMVGFAIADGALPGSAGRGYVVRRILRRAARYGRKLGLCEPFLWRLVEVLDTQMGGVFPEIRREREKVEQVIRAEEVSFNQTLDRGLALFEEELERLRRSAAEREPSAPPSHRPAPLFPGAAAFKLYDTYGFPLDLTEVMAREHGLAVDVEEFEELMRQQRSRARAARVRTAQLAHDPVRDLPPTEFVGYETTEDEADVLEILGAGPEVDVVLRATPFYAEKGGQVGDTGVLTADDSSLRVADTQEHEGTVLHRVRLGDGQPPRRGERVRAVVDRERRLQIERHHTATHLLHHALREVLGPAVRQQGSLVAPDRLRFDFTHHEAVRPAELQAIERRINEHVLADDPVSWFEIPFSARPESVLAFFGDRYGERVRVVKIGGEGPGRLPEPVFDGYSMELCGGTHTRRTGEIGLFRFLHEGAIAAGVRRVEAVCGEAALDSIRRDLEVLERVAGRLGTSPRDLEKRLEALLEQARRLEKELERLRRRAAASQVDELLSRQVRVGGVPVLAAHVGERDAAYLRELADALRPRFGGVAVLAGTAGGKVALLSMVSRDLVARGFHAGELVREVARELGGGGGGRPDLAQAGARDSSRLAQALEKVPELVRRSG